MTEPDPFDDDGLSDSDTDQGTPQEILDRCFGVDPGMRDGLSKGRVPAKMLRSMAWVTGRPEFRWQSALGLAGIAAGPQILWWQNGDPTLLTWLSPAPALLAFAWWVGRRASYRGLVRRHLGGRMVTSLEGISRTATRWSANAEGERTPHQTLHVGSEAFPLPASMGTRTIEGKVRIHLLSLVSLAHPDAPPTQWLVAVELLEAT